MTPELWNNPKVVETNQPNSTKAELENLKKTSQSPEQKENKALYKKNWEYAKKIAIILDNFTGRPYIDWNDWDYWFKEEDSSVTLLKINLNHMKQNPDKLNFYMSNKPLNGSTVKNYQHDTQEEEMTALRVNVSKTWEVLVNERRFPANKLETILTKIYDNVKVLQKTDTKRRLKEADDIIGSIDY